MIDELALDESTPGPLIMVIVFVGFMVGHNHYGNSNTKGSPGLVTTTIYTFLSCFLYIFAGAPIVECTRENKKIIETLSLITTEVLA